MDAHNGFFLIFIQMLCCAYWFNRYGLGVQELGELLKSCTDIARQGSRNPLYRGRRALHVGSLCVCVHLWAPTYRGTADTVKGFIGTIYGFVGICRERSDLFIRAQRKCLNPGAA